ncbi:hypothetical protein ACCD06_00395 [Azospirillum sp. CT11-132]|uniref:hypothetical protein n=1 Tax=Azospirillum sp. CT11-132 TaxID=3396317 RepID=UPI0039A51B9C
MTDITMDFEQCMIAIRPIRGMREETTMAIPKRKPQENGSGVDGESLMAHLDANGGRLPEPIATAVNKSCRDAFLRARALRAEPKP